MVAQAAIPAPSILRPHPAQANLVYTDTRYTICRAGRRSGKTVGLSILAVIAMCQGQRVLYVAPDISQSDYFWGEVTKILLRNGRLCENQPIAENDSLAERRFSSRPLDMDSGHASGRLCRSASNGRMAIDAARSLDRGLRAHADRFWRARCILLHAAEHPECKSQNEQSAQCQ